LFDIHDATALASDPEDIIYLGRANGDIGRSAGCRRPARAGAPV
jgi:hypothetical protein